MSRCLRCRVPVWDYRALRVMRCADVSVLRVRRRDEGNGSRCAPVAVVPQVGYRRVPVVRSAVLGIADALNADRLPLIEHHGVEPRSSTRGFTDTRPRPS